MCVWAPVWLCMCVCRWLGGWGSTAKWHYSLRCTFMQISYLNPQVHTATFAQHLQQGRLITCARRANEQVVSEQLCISLTAKIHSIFSIDFFFLCTVLLLSHRCEWQMCFLCQCQFPNWQGKNKIRKKKYLINIQMCHQQNCFFSADCSLMTSALLLNMTHDHSVI